MVSAQTKFDLADDVVFVLDADKANGLRVTDDAANPFAGAADTTVIVNNLGAEEVNFTLIKGNTLIANVPVDVTLDPDSVIDTGAVTAGYAAIVGAVTDGTATTPETSAFTLVDMDPGESITINGLTVSADPNATAAFTAADVASVFDGATVPGSDPQRCSGNPDRLGRGHNRRGWCGCDLLQHRSGRCG